MNVLTTREAVTDKKMIVPSPPTPKASYLFKATAVIVVIALEMTFKTILFPSESQFVTAFPGILIWMAAIAAITIPINRVAFIPRYDTQYEHTVAQFLYATGLTIVANHNLTGNWTINPRAAYEQVLIAPLENPLVLIAAFVYVLTISRIAKQWVVYDFIGIPLALVSLYLTAFLFDGVAFGIVLNVIWFIVHVDHKFTSSIVDWRDPPGIRINPEDVPYVPMRY